MEKEDKKRPRWSKEEVSRLRQIMTRYTVDREGLAVAAQELNKSISAVNGKWYKIKPNKMSKLPRKDLADVLYKNISKNPGNISEALRQTAEQTGRSYRTIHHAYYDKNSSINRNNIATCFVMASKHRMAANAKNYDSSKAPKTTKQRIKVWIANILGIKKEDL